jgi:hypothetical protein
VAVLGRDQQGYLSSDILSIALMNCFCIFYETGINSDPSGSRVLQKDGVIVSNSLAAFAYIRGTSMN